MGGFPSPFPGDSEPEGPGEGLTTPDDPHGLALLLQDMDDALLDRFFVG